MKSKDLENQLSEGEEGLNELVAKLYDFDKKDLVVIDDFLNRF